MPKFIAQLKKILPAWVVVTISFFLLGLIFVIISPPGQIPDEFGHIWRAYQISHGEFIPKTEVADGIKRYGGNIDGALTTYTIAQSAFDASANPRPLHANFQPNIPLTGSRGFLRFDNIAAYSPLVYLPAAAAVSISRICNFQVATIFYLARFANLLTATFFVSLGCWLLRKKLSPLLLLVFLPSSLFLVGSVSQDGIIASASFLAASAFVAICKGISGRPAAIVLASALLLVTGAKLPYLPLIVFLYLPLFFITKSQRKKYLIGSVLSGLVIITYALAWHYAIKDVSIAAIMPQNMAATSHVDPEAQQQLLVQHPLSGVKLLYRTNLTAFSDRFTAEVFGMFGYSTNGSVVLPTIVIICWTVAAAWILGHELQPRWRKLISWPGLLAIAGIGMAFLLSEYALYAYWTNVGDVHIIGLQGRYYLPLLLFSLGFACAIDKQRQPELRLAQVLLPMIGINLFAIILIAQTYYQTILGSAKL